MCQRGDFAAGYGPRTMVTCEACLDKGTHVECWHAHSGEMLTEERLASPSFQWFCCEASRCGGRRRRHLSAYHCFSAHTCSACPPRLPAGLQAGERPPGKADGRDAAAAGSRAWRRCRGVQVHRFAAAASCHHGPLCSQGGAGRQVLLQWPSRPVLPQQEKRTHAPIADRAASCVDACLATCQPCASHALPRPAAPAVQRGAGALV